MKKLGWIFSIFFIIVFLACPMAVHADTGPKPSVVITFTGLVEENYYVTLLSERESTGPWSYLGPYYDYMGERIAFQKFSEFRDADGFYFLSFMQDCSDDDKFEWTYYPSERFKVLIYYPDRDTLHVSNIYETYAFDSYFTVNVEEISSSTPLILQKDYNWGGEIVSLIARILITILVEMVIALLFGYRDRKDLRIIGIANISTQIILNLLLNVIKYQSGYYSFIFHYVWMELVVMVIEGYVYTKYTDAVDRVTGKEMHPVFYTIAANAASCAIGVWLAGVIPSTF